MKLGWVDILVLCWPGHGSSETTTAVVGWSSPRWAFFVNQLDLFLPPCPITTRYNAIPAGYNGLLHADSSHQILRKQAAAPCGAYWQDRTYRRDNHSTKTPGNPCNGGKSDRVLALFRPHRSWSPRHYDTVAGNRRFNEVTMAMSFLVDWIQTPPAEPRLQLDQANQPNFPDL
jgi:hypothetical protein